jgi:hypothetical protein
MSRSNFDTPSPIAVTLDLYVAAVRLAAASANGEVRIGEVVRGMVSATSKNGAVEVHASTKLGDVTIRRAPRLDQEA